MNFFNRRGAALPKSLPLALGSLGFVSLVAVNWLISRRTEKRHPPQGSFMTVHGVKIHYSDRGDGPPLVLIHGNAVTGDDWNVSGLAERLLKSHRVIIFDRPGCGHSERPRGRVWTVAQQADLLHQAVVQLGISKPVIVGHSLGTLVALNYAIRFQPETAALVLLSGYYFWTLRPDVALVAPTAFPLLGDMLRYTISPFLNWLGTPLLKRLLFSPAPVPVRFQEGYSTAMVSRPSQIRATAVDGALIIAGVLHLRRQYKELELPITLIAGDGDKIVFARQSRRLHAELGYSTLNILKSVGHMVHHTATAEVATAIEDVFALDLAPES